MIFSKLIAAAVVALAVTSGVRAQSYTLANTTCSYCPEGQVPVSNGQNIQPASGCGPGNGFIADLIPEYRFGDCCNAHDNCYATCGAVKEDCDRRFYGCMTRTCDEDYPTSDRRRNRCKAVAGCYAGSIEDIDVSSCRAYTKDQEEQCVCQPGDKATFVNPLEASEDDLINYPNSRLNICYCHQDLH
eukprot:TRINITY_DN9829_c1_g1_i2.p1 TRINITY_DN9829_c1_g1~~TRINITY_DN9829_c1_g1_i2.p1  ORF type:complete len:213 (-),score=34.86 TRINITY_DN9829_c1_g1_i2:68-628(-)